MAVSFSEQVVWREQGDPQLRALTALMGDDPDAARRLADKLESLRHGFSQTDFAQPWGMACFSVEDCMVFARMRKTPEHGWVYRLQAANLAPYIGRGAELRPASILPESGAFAQWVDDGMFLEALRDAAFLTCLAPGDTLHCKIKENRRTLAEAVLADLLCHAVAPQHLRFVSFAAGSGRLPAEGFTFLLSARESEAHETGAFADFTASPPTLDLRFPALNFARRTAKALLAPLGLSVLASMWNAAERLVVETLGEQQAAAAQDLVAWQMLRKNFPSGDYPITEEEHRALQGKVKRFQGAG